MGKHCVEWIKNRNYLTFHENDSGSNFLKCHFESILDAEYRSRKYADTNLPSSKNNSRTLHSLAYPYPIQVYLPTS